MKQPAPKPTYFETVQRGKITRKVRANIVMWLLSCGEMFELLPETSETAVYLLDRLLSLALMPTEKHVRIVAATCMLIAAKTCEVQGHGVTVRDLVRACGAVFSANDMQRMERVILGRFGWSGVGKVVTPRIVVDAIGDVAQCMPGGQAGVEMRAMTTTLLAESMAADWFLHFNVVVIATSALMAALERYHACHAMKGVRQELLELTHADPEAVDECTYKMRRAEVVDDIPMF